ncbi:MAG: hypothetical protein HC945_02315 [Nitrosarchaeum sp.]|nr:hypothetical protein [Nitrosarchaeum sp.]
MGGSKQSGSMESQLLDALGRESVKISMNVPRILLDQVDRLAKTMYSTRTIVMLGLITNGMEPYVSALKEALPKSAVWRRTSASTSA